MPKKIKFTESVYSKNKWGYHKEYHATVGRRKANQEVNGMYSAGGRSTIRLKIRQSDNDKDDYICEITCCPFSERICGQWKQEFRIHAMDFDSALDKAKELSLTCMVSAIDLEIKHLKEIKDDVANAVLLSKRSRKENTP